MFKFVLNFPPLTGLPVLFQLCEWTRDQQQEVVPWSPPTTSDRPLSRSSRGSPRRPPAHPQYNRESSSKPQFYFTLHQINLDQNLDLQIFSYYLIMNLLLLLFRRPRSEYSSNFRSPTKFQYDGAWHGADPPHLQPTRVSVCSIAL